MKMKSFQPKTSYTVFAERISDRIPANVKKATSGAVRVWNEWSDEGTSLPTSSRQEDEFEFVVAPVIELLVVVVVVKSYVVNFFFNNKRLRTR